MSIWIVEVYDDGYRHRTLVDSMDFGENEDAARDAFTEVFVTFGTAVVLVEVTKDGERQTVEHRA